MALTKGVTQIGLGTIAVDGGPATSFTPLGLTDADSTASLTQADATKTEHFALELDDPYDVEIKPGSTTLVYSLLNPDPDKLLAVFGGTVSGSGLAKKWKAPLQAVNIEKSVQIIPHTGMVLTICRGQISAKFNWNLSKGSKLVIDLSVAVLASTKAGESSIEFGPDVSELE